MKRFIKVAVIVILALVILIYPAVFITNNMIADSLEKKLKGYDLPESSELIDSLSIAGKYTGNGNGMQYLGVVLIKSELSLEEIKVHYSNSGNIVVYEQADENIGFLDRPSGHRFKDFDADDGEHYAVALWGHIESDFIRVILDSDLRGH